MTESQQLPLQSSSRIGYWIDRLLASDPALDRLRTGVRAVLIAALGAGLLSVLARWLGQDPQLSLVGVVVPMMSAVAIQDPGRPQQRLTMALIPVVATGAISLGSWVAGNPWLSGACFLATIFAAFEARRFGPRGTALGMIGYLSYFYAMFLGTSLDKLPWLALFLFAGCGIGYAVRFWLVSERPDGMLRSEVRAFRARIAALLYDLAELAELACAAADGQNRRRVRRIRASLAALNEQSLAIEDRLTRYAPEAPQAAGNAGSAEDDLRGRVLRCEIAAETLATVARTASSAENQDAPARHRLAALLRALREAVRGGAPFDAAAGSKAVTVDGTATPLDADLRWRFRRAAETLTERAAWEVPLPALREESVPPPSPEEPRPMFDDHTRRALQACAAALAAMLAGHAISDQRWYWAVIAAFVVFTRAMTLGQALSQAWQRVLATVVGVGIGLLIAELVHGNRDLELALLFVFVAVGFYLFRAYQPAYVMLLTAMLAMLYELIGRYSPGVLYVRLAETLAGAAAAAISAALILPVRTSEIADRNSAALLREASGLLRTAFDRADRPAPPDAVRDLDRKLQALRRELEPVTETSYPAPKAAGRRRLHRLSILVYCIRHLYNLRAGQPTDPDRLRALRGMAHTVAENMEALAAVLEADDGKRHRNAAAPKTLSRPAPVMHGDPQQGAAAGDQWRITAGWLWESNDVLRAMYGDATA